MAVEGSHKDTVDYLVQQGADINSKDNNEVSTYHYTTDDRFVLLMSLLGLIDLD